MPSCFVLAHLRSFHTCPCAFLGRMLPRPGTLPYSLWPLSQTLPSAPSPRDFSKEVMCACCQLVSALCAVWVHVPGLLHCVEPHQLLSRAVKWSAYSTELRMQMHLPFFHARREAGALPRSLEEIFICRYVLMLKKSLMLCSFFIYLFLFYLNYFNSFIKASVNVLVLTAAYISWES